MVVLKSFIVSLFLLGATLASAAELTNSLKPFANAEAAEGKDVRFLYLWATWCPDCREKLRGDIPNFKKEFPQVSVQTVNMDRRADKATGFITDEKVSLTVLRDEEKLLTKKLQLYSVPAWVVIKRDGEKWTVVGKAMGSDLQDIRTSLAQATGGKL